VTIEGYVRGRDTQPFVDIQLEIPALKIKKKLPFLIDTGASSTILSVRDARTLQLDYGKLSPAKGKVIGLGGPLYKTFELKKVILHFFGGKKTLSVPLDSLLISGDEKKLEAQFELELLSQIEKALLGDEKSLKHIPSVLGMDVLRSFTFTYNANRKIVQLKS
jgi:hypothetical protein